LRDAELRVAPEVTLSIIVKFADKKIQPIIQINAQLQNKKFKIYAKFPVVLKTITSITVSYVNREIQIIILLYALRSQTKMTNFSFEIKDCSNVWKEFV